MKKIFTLTLVVIMALSLISCKNDKPKEAINDQYANSEDVAEDNPKETMDEQYSHAEGFVDNPPIRIEDTPITFTSKDNTVTATFTNNSDKIITSYRVTVLNKSTNKKAYFDCSKEVDSKKTSPNLQSSESTVTKEEDIEIQKYAVGFTDEKGLDRIVRYNCKTKKYILI